MSVENGAASLEYEPGFCRNCGTILPIVSDSNLLKCLQCYTNFTVEAYGLKETRYVLHFHNPEDYLRYSKVKDDAADGPVIKRKCRNCGNDEMSYTTLQLRSADEGQTVFYKCTKCQFNECENS